MPAVMLRPACAQPQAQVLRPRISAPDATSGRPSRNAPRTAPHAAPASASARRTGNTPTTPHASFPPVGASHCSLGASDDRDSVADNPAVGLQSIAPAEHSRANARHRTEQRRLAGYCQYPAMFARVRFPARHACTDSVVVGG